MYNNFILLHIVCTIDRHISHTTSTHMVCTLMTTWLVKLRNLETPFMSLVHLKYFITLILSKHSLPNLHYRLIMIHFCTVFLLRSRLFISHKSSVSAWQLASLSSWARWSRPFRHFRRSRWTAEKWETPSWYLAY